MPWSNPQGVLMPLRCCSCGLAVAVAMAVAVVDKSSRVIVDGKFGMLLTLTLSHCFTHAQGAQQNTTGR